MTPAELSRTVLHAVCRAVEDGALVAPVPESVKVERPRPGGCGDYATNVALRLARAAGQSTRAVAETLRDRIAREPGIAAVEITGPGFLNITLEDGLQQALVQRVREQGLRYGYQSAALPARDPATSEPSALPVRDTHAASAGPAPGAEDRARVWADTVRRIRRSQGMDMVTEVATDACGLPVSLPAPPAPDALVRGGPAVSGNPARGNPAPAAPGSAHPQRAPRPGALAPGPSAASGNPDPTAPRTAPGPARPQPAPRPGAPRTIAAGQSLGDALRWGFLAVAAHDRPRGVETLLRQHESNPLFTVRYAYSRSRALTRGAARLGFGGEPVEYVETPLTGLVADYPGVLDSAARLGAPDRLARHLESTADALLGFQHTVLPSGEEKPTAAHRSRLAVAEAAGTVLAGGLSLLGISAPAHL
ncbi:ArgS-related anticodon-binding protein NrtL [Streptomyces sp. NPDC051018]|uniref:ArgS-related anticodon-binding protein NrtL n=1 Tax=Streptomyces sp. NPDC051018 TaxID=3365639 RepID=UPI0037B22962